jgi:hypothetical protein
MHPAQNRVTPLGEIVATPLRGAWTGNRGRLHEGHRIVRSHASNLWITCALSFRDWWHPQWQPRHFTWLFFHDEAVSLAAGHRPCALCRRADYERYRSAWHDALGGAIPKAEQMNRRLHEERIVPGTSRRRFHRIPWRDLPDGAFVLLDGRPALVLGESLVEWSASGYGAGRARPRQGIAQVVTPPSSLAALRADYGAQIDATARTSRPS